MQICLPWGTGGKAVIRSLKDRHTYMKETDFQNGRTQQQVGELLEFTLGTGVLLFTFSPCIHSMAQSRVRVHTPAPDLTKVVSWTPGVSKTHLPEIHQSH